MNAYTPQPPPAQRALDERATRPPSTVRLRHPLECLPYRPPQKPRWAPRIEVRSDKASEPVGARLNPSFKVADDLGPVRVNFVYAGFQSVAAAHSDKARRDQFFESANETHGFRRHTVDTTVVELLYQPMTLSWETVDGTRYSLTFDYGVGTDDGRVVFGEDKASLSYLLDPHVRGRLDYAEGLLADCGATLERRIAGGAANALQRRVVKDIFDGQRTWFDLRDESAAREVISREGGAAPFALVLERLGRHAALGRNMIFAMSCKRVLAIPIDRPPMPDTPVWIPRAPARTAPLRDFMAARMSKAAEDGEEEH